MINNIQNLIFKSKNKIEKDLFEIEKKEKENSVVYGVGINREIKILKKSKRKKIENKDNKEMNLRIKKRRINKNKFNERYITDNDIKENRSFEKEKSNLNNKTKKVLI